MRRTKIISTIGPASMDWEIIRAMYDAGMNAVRINMSHASYDDAERAIQWIKTLNRKVKYAVPVIVDTSGPEVRIGHLEKPLELRNGQHVALTSRVNPEMIDGLTSIHVGYPEFEEAMAVGDYVRIDNGLINLRVLDKGACGLRCRVLDGGTLGSKKHVNLPGVHINMPSITSKDVQDIEFVKEQEVSFIAQSFVRTADDIREMRELLGHRYRWVRVIAKIENFEGVDQAEEISNVADGLMIARGDLGIETDMAALPTLQRRLVETTLKKGRRCVVATHLLESMVEKPIPTRAEVVDVANAIYQGVDAVMLSAETSVGKYPVGAVEVLRRIAEEQEKLPSETITVAKDTQNQRQLMAWSAAELAERINAKGIVVITRSGHAADMVTNTAPSNIPVFAFSNRSHTRRQLMLNRSVYAHRISFSRQPEVTIKRAFTVLREREGLPDDASVIVMSSLSDASPIDSITIRQVGDLLEPGAL
ncbi:MAG: pyruvate kinase [Gammaproteobacteria bacterium]|nr:pyruvate kinase [Gammaproteobacteria bacterium]